MWEIFSLNRRHFKNILTHGLILPDRFVGRCCCCCFTFNLAASCDCLLAGFLLLSFHSGARFCCKVNHTWCASTPYTAQTITRNQQLPIYRISNWGLNSVEWHFKPICFLSFSRTDLFLVVVVTCYNAAMVIEYQLGESERYFGPRHTTQSNPIS